MFAIAFWALPKIKDCGAFLVGSRRMGKLMIVAAAFAGGTNANHPMAVAAAAFQKGMSGIWLSLTWILITPFFWLYGPAIRRLRIVTLVDIVRMRFGGFMGVLFKIVTAVKFPVAMGLGIKSAAIVLQVMTGGQLSGFEAEALIVFPTLGYTLIGGIIAAYATDVFQSLLIVVLSFLLIPFAIARAGGIGRLDAGIADELTSLLSGAAGDFSFWWILWFAVGITFSAAISSVGGSAAARDEWTARMGIFGSVIKRFCTVGWGLVGLFAIALFAGHPMLDPASGLPGASPDNVFPLASGELLPVVLRGLMVAAILAAVMSSLAGGILGFGGMIVNNVYQEHFVQGASARHYLFMARVFSAVGLALSWYVASSIDDIVEFATIVEPLGSLTGIAILVALVWRRVTAAGAVVSVLVASPLFMAANIPTWPEWSPVALFDMLHLRPVADWMASWYGMDLSQPDLGYVDAGGELLRLPVQVKYPLYLIPTLLSLIGVSLVTRQHDPHAVAEFYCRLDTPVGQEESIRAAGFRADQLELLDEKDPEAVEGRHSTERLLLTDFLYLPKLLATGQAKLSDYKWDWIGVAGSVAFVVLFLWGVEALGSLF